MRDDSGHLKVADFGVSKLLAVKEDKPLTCQDTSCGCCFSSELSLCTLEIPKYLKCCIFLFVGHKRILSLLWHFPCAGLLHADSWFYFLKLGNFLFLFIGRYVAPEVFRQEYDTKVDVFSFALILQEVTIFNVSSSNGKLLKAIHYKIFYGNIIIVIFYPFILYPYAVWNLSWLPLELTST